jgi:CheY-like chemotaxis protein
MVDVLIVDDDDMFGELLVDWLEGAGLSCEFQQGPFGTINRIRRALPKVLVLDINMPAISGPEVFRLLASAPGLSHVKVLLMSSMDPSALEDLRIELGAPRALSKGASREQVLDAVKQLMRVGAKVHP